MPKRAKSKLQKIIVIIGPTASGKSDLAMRIARKIGGEIISADSRQIYRGMDIGTAKPSLDEQKTVNHHLINVVNPNQEYTIQDFKKDALRAIYRIILKGKQPILVGGTGLYISSIVNNLKIPRVKENKNLRAKLEKEIKRYGLAHIFSKLIKLDPEAAYIVDPKNPRRVIRALEIALETGLPFSAQRKIGKPLFDFTEIGLLKPDEELKEIIKTRIKVMMGNGLLAEVKNLVKNYGYNAKPFDAIGYREIISYLKGEMTLEQAVDSMVKNTQRYAKRQMTWFKKDKKIQWFDNPKKALTYSLARR